MILEPYLLDVGWDKRQRRPTICPMWWAGAPLVPPYEFTNWTAVPSSMLLRPTVSVPSELTGNAEILRFERTTTFESIGIARLCQFQRRACAVYESSLVFQQGHYSCRESQPIRQEQHDFLLQNPL